jgi:hypothetical protein
MRRRQNRAGCYWTVLAGADAAPGAARQRFVPFLINRNRRLQAARRGGFFVAVTLLGNNFDLAQGEKLYRALLQFLLLNTLKAKPGYYLKPRSNQQLSYTQTNSADGNCGTANKAMNYKKLIRKIY